MIALAGAAIAGWLLVAAPDRKRPPPPPEPATAELPLPPADDAASLPQQPPPRMGLPPEACLNKATSPEQKRACCDQHPGRCS